MKNKAVIMMSVLIIGSLGMFAGEAETLPLTSVSLFSSGVGYFEHSGFVSGDGILSFEFPENAVNDVLKSLIIIDSETKNPAVSYSAENTLEKTLKSLKIDLSETPDIATIFSSLRGSEVELSVPEKIKGRILGTEVRALGSDGVYETYVSISGSNGTTFPVIQTFKISEIASFSFTDPAIGKDLERALELLRTTGQSTSRMVEVSLPGKGKRLVTIAYVIETPVWKATYRLDLSEKAPLLQGWAIVDNTGDLDWNGVTLSFLNGKPVSFIQNLYAPYFVERPVLPLAIAGSARAQVWTSGYGDSNDYEMDIQESEASPVYGRVAPVMKMKQASIADMNTQTTEGEAVGAMFKFTVKTPVTVLRQHSTMLPLVQERILAEKISVFSGEQARRESREIHPQLCAFLTNTSGMKLPAGPVTVFDGGTYAGDALLEFFPENEKRIIGFGEDLSVRGSISTDSRRETVAVKILKGVMSIARRNFYDTVYVFSNKGVENKTLFIEHPIRHGTELTLPVQFEERTSSLYRFRTSIAGNTESRFIIEETEIVSERVVLSEKNIENLIIYSSSRDIPQKVQKVLEKAVALKKAVDDRIGLITELEGQKKVQLELQERIRQNLAAAGNDSSLGKDYLLRLSSSDGEIDRLEEILAIEKQKLFEHKKDYELYLSNLTIE